MALRPLARALSEWTPGNAPLASPLHALAAAWPSIVGPAVAAQSRPLELNGTTLLVGTRSSAWSQQLHFLSPPILAAIRGLRPPLVVERLVFRVTPLRRGQAPEAARAALPSRVRRAAPEHAGVAAEDLAGTLARVRRRMARVRAAAARTCDVCGAPLERADRATCAPCHGARAGSRALALERILYMAPWLGWEELHAQLPGLSSTEYEAARRRLLQRWWLVLERVRRAAAVRATPLERQVASSYVLLHSRVAPDRITPAIVRNLLGQDLEARLWPEHAPPSPGS